MKGINKSKVYGYYGGVTNENHYVPPVEPDFVPCPPTVVFNSEYRTMLLQILSSVNFTDEYLLSRADEIMIRRLLSAADDEHKTFEIFTQKDPNDIITYTTEPSGDVDLVTLDGGTF